MNLKAYESPYYEISAYKNIPIEYLDIVQRQVRKFKHNMWYARYRFRGPRFDQHRAHTTKAHANRFSVYMYRKAPLV